MLTGTATVIKQRMQMHQSAHRNMFDCARSVLRSDTQTTGVPIHLPHRRYVSLCSIREEDESRM